MNKQTYPKSEFHDRRKQGIGGSDIGAILNVSAFRTPLDVYCEKMGLSDRQPETFAMRMGNKMESIIIEEYLNCNDHSVHVEHSDSENNIILTKGDIYYYHPDGILMDVLPDSPVGLLECKYSTRYSAWGLTEEEIPLEYQYQCQWGLFVSELPYCDLALIIGREYRQFRIIRDDRLIERLKTAVDSFWSDYIRKETPPPPTDRKSDEELLKALYADSGITIEADVEIVQYADAYLTLKDEIDVLEAKKQEVKNKIQVKLKDANTCVSDFFKISWKQGKDRVSVDYKSVFEQAVDEFPRIKDFVEPNTKASPGSRPLLVRRINE